MEKDISDVETLVNVDQINNRETIEKIIITSIIIVTIIIIISLVLVSTIHK